MFETEKYIQEDCLIVHPDLSLVEKGSDRARDAMEAAQEAEGLAAAIKLDVLYTHIVKPKKIVAGSFLGRGQREDIARLVEDYKPDVLIFNGTLSPIQQRNLEKEWHTKVIDRTGLILEIFGERAQTKEGRLQVDLAMLEYQKSRLVRSWTHLERQRGGAGFMGGPGERQIEIDRRLISERIVKLKKDIEDVRRTRDLGRQSRDRVPFPVVALVGYTNAGKSTLFNTLTGAKVMAEDLLFATLDPTMRRLELPGGQDIILSDTVGFISDLPTHLVAAFRATLEQVLYADVILHVMDVSHEDFEREREDVIRILKDMGVEYESDERVIEVWNKVDQADEDRMFDVNRHTRRPDTNAFAISALKGQGTDVLLKAIEHVVERNYQEMDVDIPVTDGKALAWVYAHGHVLKRKDAEDKIKLRVRLEPAMCAKFKQKFKYAS